MTQAGKYPVLRYSTAGEGHPHIRRKLGAPMKGCSLY